MRSKAGALIWLLVILGTAIWLALRTSAGPVINTDLLSLLPTAQADPAVRAAAQRVHDAAERKLLLVLSAGETDIAREAARFVAAQLAETDRFAEVQLQRKAEDLRQLGALYFPYRKQLLSAETRQSLLEGDQEAFQQRLLSRYLNPVAALSSGLVEADPLLLLPDFLAALTPGSSAKLRFEEGFLTLREEDRVHILILAELGASPFSMTLQDALAPHLESLRSAVREDYPGATLMLAGVLPHATAGTASARREVSVVGLGSLLGILLLFILVFRSLGPFFMAALAIAIGCLAGFAAVLAVFGQVHLITLVFGASLVGISVDYALHYFCERVAGGRHQSAHEALRTVFPGITLGLVTSIVGFGGILLAPFPGLREMAVFSSIGLVAAWLCVVLLYPLMPQGPVREGGRPLRWMATYARFWERDQRRGLWMVLAGLTLLSFLGCLKLAPLDDFRMLQARDPAVLADEERIRALFGQAFAGQYFLVRADHDAQALEREEALIADLQPLLEAGALSGYTALSSFVPSPARQAENRALVAALLSSETGALPTLVATLGLPEAVRHAYEDEPEARDGPHVLGLQDWLASPASMPFRHLWLAEGGSTFSVIPLAGVRDAAALRALAASHADVSFVDRVGELSQLFTSYRSKTLWLTALSYVVVTLLLVLRYGARGAVGVMAVPVVAALASFGALGFLSEPISLFNVMALLLILGIGVDYGIFLREAGRVRPATLLAVALSAVTTGLAFGLLSVSATTAVHAFGLTVLLGIAAAFLLSPLAAALLPSRCAARKGRAL